MYSYEVSKYGNSSILTRVHELWSEPPKDALQPVLTPSVTEVPTLATSLLPVFYEFALRHVGLVGAIGAGYRPDHLFCIVRGS